MNDIFSLKGKTILVAGGTRGIGRAISCRFTRVGASVIANYVRNEKKAQSFKDEMEGEGLSVQLCRADLVSEKGLQKVKECVGELSLSGLVYCSATGVHMSFEKMTTRHWDWTFNLNLRAFFELVKNLLPNFQEGSTIVGLSSEGAVHAVPSYTLVGASKGGLEAFCRHLSVELAHNKIRVNILSPGSVLTDAWDAFPDKENRLQKEIQSTPGDRLVTLDEVACSAQFLCSDASLGINGHTLVVDRGKRVNS